MIVCRFVAVYFICERRQHLTSSEISETTAYSCADLSSTCKLHALLKKSVDTNFRDGTGRARDVPPTNFRDERGTSRLLISGMGRDSSLKRSDYLWNLAVV